MTNSFILVVSDVNDIRYVINFDFPTCVEDYVHRIGRTARATKTGTAFTLFTPDDATHAAELIKVMRQANQEVDDQLHQYANYRVKKG